MKKNSVFSVMILLSLALHGFVLLGRAESKPNAPPPEPENWPLTKVKLTRMVKPPPKSVPAPIQQQEKKVIEKKPVETPPEPAPREETETKAEIVAEAEAGDEAMSGETYGMEGEAIAAPEYSETDGSGEYEEFLAYISSLISQNLLYPQMARRRNIEGVVRLQFVIGKDGSLVSARVDRSSGSSILDKAAVSLIEKICPIKGSAIKRSMSLHININYELTG
ncbi:MAG: energy transducer TonB [Spirochaetaceae bacterium]|jgi:protein TonB|nr:energy transducer TonB [Spirochaetaceae bacterium]